MNNLFDSFSLTIKIGAKMINFTVNTHQSTDLMFQKLKLIHPQCEYKKEETLDKLKNDLQNKLKTQNIKETMVKTIKYYLSKNFKQKMIVKSQRQSQRKLDSSLTTQNISFKASPVNQKVVENQQNKTKKESRSVLKNMVKTKRNPKLRAFSSQRKTESHLKSKSQSKNLLINEDLIKAYQAILQKSTQSDIKVMAKKFLEEMGKLPQADRKIQPTITFKKEASLLDQHEARTELKQSSLQILNKSPIQVIELPSQNRQKEREKMSEIPQKTERNSYFKLFATNKYKYMPEASLPIQQKRRNGEQLSLSYLRFTHVPQRKFNYLQNMV